MYAQNISTINWWALLIGVLSIGIIAVTPRFSKKISGSLLAIILMTVLVCFLRNNLGIQGIETIGDRFTINASIPAANKLYIDFDTVRTLLPVAFTIAMLGAIESLLSATVADGVIGSKHNSNTELIAQGIANVITPIFGGIPATGAIARTMTNINNGGRTPVTGIIHAIHLALILFFLGGLTKHIPMACLAGLLMIVAYSMSEWRTFKSLMRNTKSDVTVLLATFLFTVIFDLTIAIEVGLLLAVLLFLRRISEVSTVSVIQDVADKSDYVEGAVDSEKLEVPKGVSIYEIEGPFFFGVANKFEETMKQVGDTSKVRVIRMRKVPFIDSTGVHNLDNLIKMSQKDKTKILLSGVNDNVREVLRKVGIDQLIGSENIYDNINDALEKSKQLIRKRL